MKLIPLAAVSIALAGCAAAPEVPQLTGTAPDSASERVKPEDIEIAAVIELEPRSEFQSEEPCQRTLVTGTRIARVQCEDEIPESERLLNQAIVRSQIEYAREMALLEEQRRVEQAAEEALRQMQTRGPR